MALVTSIVIISNFSIVVATITFALLMTAAVQERSLFTYTPVLYYYKKPI